MGSINSTPLVFGVNPFDHYPNQIGRYHVVNQFGYIVAKCRYGFAAYDCAGSFSDQNPDVTFSAIDTADGSVYGAYRNGESIA
jgi:hypothetical protein